MPSPPTHFTVTYKSRKAFQTDQQRLKKDGWVVELALDQAWNSKGQLTSIRVTYRRENVPPQHIPLQYIPPQRPPLRYPTGSMPESRQPFPPPQHLQAQTQAQQIVKHYQNASDFQRDRQSMERQGWTVVNGDGLRDASGNFAGLSAGFTITYQRADTAGNPAPPLVPPSSKVSTSIPFSTASVPKPQQPKPPPPPVASPQVAAAPKPIAWNSPPVYDQAVSRLGWSGLIEDVIEEADALQYSGLELNTPDRLEKLQSNHVFTIRRRVIIMLFVVFGLVVFCTFMAVLAHGIPR